LLLDRLWAVHGIKEFAHNSFHFIDLALLRVISGKAGSMRKMVNFLLIGWVLGIYAINPASVAVFNASTVEAAPALAFVSGTVKDEGGTPLIGAVVALLEARPRGKEIKSVKTDAQGHFTCRHCAGRLSLARRGRGLLPQPATYHC
jgi:hypothetical protein